MAKNRMSDLRDHLYATLEALADETNPMDLDRARTIGFIAQTVINGAKVEVDLVKAMGGTSSTFFNVQGETREFSKIGEAKP